MKFQANGQVWHTDAATLELLRQYKKERNNYMVGAIFTIGRTLGRITKGGKS